MKTKYFKYILTSLSILALIILLSACSFGNCKLKGCDREGQGWIKSNECAIFQYSVCRPVGSTSGGFCSREHAIRG
jgi:hypothetical protein